MFMQCVNVVLLQSYYSADDVTTTPSSLPPLKSRMVYPSGAGLPRLSLKRGHEMGTSISAGAGYASFSFVL